MPLSLDLFSVNLSMLKTRLFILIFTTLLLRQGLIAQGLVINELVSDNTLGTVDEDGEASDWVELYNASGEAVDVGGMGLSDEEGNEFKWVFPSREIEAWGYLVVFASGKDRIDGGELHANFSVGSEGEKLWLVGSEGEIVDEVDEVELCDDKSYGRLPDGGVWNMLETPSFGNTNNLNDIVSSSYDGGYYNENIVVELLSEMGDDIYYTLNGSIPTTMSNQYSEGILMYDRDSDPNKLCEIPTSPIDESLDYPAWSMPSGLIDKANILRFCAYREGVMTSAVETRTFFVDENIFSKYTMPVLSIVVEKDDFFSDGTGIYVPGELYDSEDPFWTGNYFQRGELWERDVHLEYFEMDGTLGFAQNAGVRIHGGITRSAAQKTLKFYARSEYNKRFFEYPLIPQKEFTEYKRFLLSSSMGEKGDAVLKDVVAGEITRGFSFETQGSQEVIVFINGEYWGIQMIRDRIDKYYAGYEGGLNEDSVDLISGIGWKAAFAGSSDGYFELIQFIEDNDLAEEENYQFVISEIDIQDYIDYTVTEMFLANYDWPGNNVKIWRPSDGSGKWRWIFFDLGWAYNGTDFNMFQHCTNVDEDVVWPNSRESTFLFRNLIKNQNFVESFTNRYAQILSEDFNRSNLLNISFAVKELYEDEMEKNIRRWHYPSSYSNWESAFSSEIQDFFEERPCEVENNIIEFFDLETFEFDCNSEISFETLTVWPNPSDGNFTIQNNSLSTIRGDLSISNLAGVTVFFAADVHFNAFEALQIAHLDISQGMYILNINGLYFRKVVKIVIQ